MANKFVVPIFDGKGDVRNCNTYKRVKPLKHAMKIVEKVLEALVNAVAMYFGSMPGRGTTDALLVVKRKHVKYKRQREKSCRYVLWILRGHLIRVSGKVLERTMKKVYQLQLQEQ